MAAQLPRQLRAFNLYNDGRSFAGRIDTFTPPPLAFLTEEHRAGGMDAPVELEMGMEALIATMVISDYDPSIIALLGKQDVPLVARGGVQAQGGRAEPVVINMRGMLKGAELSEWTAGGGKSTQNLTYSLTYFRFRQNDVELVEIDIINMVRKFGGVDQVAGLRAAIGL
ncbi:phage major tail tube protein [Neorhizobium sp. T786]|uniref:phage major tail tube protein n=1 Tax=Pseudorhizobium xiangyangii TaxID=2883104 RepID=UPI001CFF571E|nr:phage major tail tube protein [Neorhizobium xiangyangii]MCB5201727.1 phage major tail tube protein [Neorhizobium xiangyangii]